MIFKVLPTGSETPKTPHSHAYLIEDQWDDWFQYSTLYSLVYVDDVGEKHFIGGVKIGQFNMKNKQRRPKIPEAFQNFDQLFFSLGQDVTYYTNLNGIGRDVAEEILDALNDIALKDNIFKKALKENVTRQSLLRDVTSASARGQFRRLANGHAVLTPYKFKYKARRISGSLTPSLELSFEVKPKSNPPTNIHILIGRNGVGKTYLLNNMINSLLERNSRWGKFISESENEEILEEDLFANLVSITFSAFDKSNAPPDRKDKSKEIQYSYVGLRPTNEDKNQSPKSLDDLNDEFVTSLSACKSGAKITRWKKVVAMLETDPIFKALEVTSIINNVENEIFETKEERENKEAYKKRAKKLFDKLSSGHKIVLLTITRLVETVEERTLVLMDEPETHLHPPLLSAFTRALSDLLISRNGVAIIATHSPVVLQEVPKSCVWKLRRYGKEASAERPEIETFGENIGALTREVFGLEVTYSGFHKLLNQAVKKERDFESTIEHFNNELGMEARTIIRALVSLQDQEDE